jgi:hypothetical protein
MTQELIRQLFNTARNADSLQSFERVAAEILSASIADTAGAKQDDVRDALDIAEQLDEMSDRITRFSNYEGDAVCARAAQLLRTFANHQAARRKVMSDGDLQDIVMGLFGRYTIPADYKLANSVAEFVMSKLPRSAPYGAPFTTDVAHCCGDPETCNDPCEPAIDTAGAQPVACPHCWEVDCLTCGTDAAPTPERADADTAGAQSAEQERERFEADYAVVWNRSMHENGWASDHTADDVRALREGDTYGEGRDYLNARWEGWQARVALAAPPASSVADAAGASEGQAEPVAWMYTSHRGVDLCRVPLDENLKKLAPADMVEVPLYAHPSAEIAALRERIAGMEKDAERGTVTALQSARHAIYTAGTLDESFNSVQKLIDAAIAKGASK